MKRRTLLQFGAGLPLAFSASNLRAGDPFWTQVFTAMPEPFAGMPGNPEYRIQILCQYRQRGGRWHKRSWQLQPERWFSTGSVAKLPMALLACERIAAMGFDLRAQIGFTQPPIGGEWPDQEPAFEALARSLTRIFTISENPPFNRLYDFLGVDAIHDRLAALGYPAARMISRMSAPVRENVRTRAGQIRDGSGRVLAEFPERSGSARRFPFGSALTGSGFLHDDGRLETGPHDFSAANFIPLSDSQQMLKALVDPSSVPAHQRWAIPESMRREVLRIMAMLPRESTDPVYPESEYHDGYARFFLIGDSRARKPEGLHLIGKVGDAYGFATDVEYITADGSAVECLLSANVYVNADGIFNDDRYEYETLGYPFLAALGRAVWQVLNVPG
ncbi:MAG: serine hydrolase [Arenimonas sp.]